MRNVRTVTAGLVGVVVLAGLGWLAAGQIRSPAQVAADKAPPSASLITAPVERRALATEVIARGTVRFGAPQEVVLPTSELKASSTAIVSNLPRPGARLDQNARALTVSGRPVFVLPGSTPMHRDLRPGLDGRDVRQLEQALIRAGFDPGPADGRYDGATAAAVAAMYRKRDETPFGVTDLQADALHTAEAAAAAARDSLLQMRLALRTAQRGATKADISQAELDAVSADEAIPTARVAIDTGREKARAARDAQDAAQRVITEANFTGAREIAVADADVRAKQAAVNEAVDKHAEAQRNLNDAPPETTPSERESLRAAVRQAAEAIDVAGSALTAANRTTDAARASHVRVIADAQADGRRAGREIAVAGSEVRQALASLTIARRKSAVAHARVSILRATPDTALERQIVDQARSEVRRTGAEVARLALRTGIQVPADEILFFPTLPLRVDTVAATRGSQVSGSVMTVTNSRLAIDSSLSVADAKLVRRGLPVRIEEQDLGLKVDGRVGLVAGKPGTSPISRPGVTQLDPGRTYAEVIPSSAPPTLVGASVKLSISVQSTRGKVLAVPVGALSVAGDGTSRVQVALSGGKTRYVSVVPGLAAQGFAEVTPTRKGSLEEGDRVVVGAGGGAATKAPTGVGADPIAGGQGSAGGATTTPDPGTTTTPAPAAPAPQQPSSGAPAAPAPSAPAAPAQPSPTVPGAPSGP